ncbi:hypothetical protein KM043_005974 [Ampulex compressa]|nr:hypothetical protein KM043_005974 [Ampulex compressa]
MESIESGVRWDEMNVEADASADRELCRDHGGSVWCLMSHYRVMAFAVILGINGVGGEEGRSSGVDWRAEESVNHELGERELDPVPTFRDRSSRGSNRKEFEEAEWRRARIIAGSRRFASVPASRRSNIFILGESANGARRFSARPTTLARRNLESFLWLFSSSVRGIDSINSAGGEATTGG